MKAYKRILVPVDGSRLSYKAARGAATLARDLKASITAVYVMPQWTPPTMMDIPGAAIPAEMFDERAFIKRTEATASAALEKVRTIARWAEVKCDTVAVRDGQPWRGIVKAAKGCDVIAMASHGRTGIEAAMLGSETRKVLAHSRKPVLVYR